MNEICVNEQSHKVGFFGKDLPPYAQKLVETYLRVFESKRVDNEVILSTGWLVVVGPQLSNLSPGIEAEAVVENFCRKCLKLVPLIHAELSRN